VALPVATVLSAATGIWYLSRPLPQPHISEYRQITYDGHIGSIAGTDGNRIYFNMSVWGPIAQVGVTGGEIVTIPTNSKQAEVADVSADGASLLIWSWDPPEFRTMATVGGSPRLIQKNSSGLRPAWSPEMKYIAYSDSDGKSLFTMRSDGTDVHKLTTFKSFITDVAWSPDSGRIRFTVDNTL
jgi:hypothetical protein